MFLLLMAAFALAQDDTARFPTIQLGPVDAVLGDQDAPWTIVQYSDWQCPHCATAFSRIEEWVAGQRDVRVVFKVFPLNGECNPTLTSTGPSPRCALAWGSACAAEQGRWPAYAAWAMGSMSLLSDVRVEDLAGRTSGLGLDPTRFGACVTSHRARQRVQADALEGARLDITGTPSFFVHDRVRGDWIKTSGGVEGAITTLDALREGRVEAAPLPAERP